MGNLDIESSVNEKIIHNSTRTSKNSEPTKAERNSFCPPIFLQNVNITSLIEQLKAKKIEFKIKNQSNSKSKLFLKDATTHTEMIALLKEKNIASYTYTPKEFKRQSIVCRGLYFKTDVNDIKSEIDKFVPDTVETVTKFSTDFSRKHGVDTSLFLVTLKANRKANEILGIRYILEQRVYWEKPKASKKIPRCWRCQQWGHFSKNCSRPFSCGKCNKKHEPGSCEIGPDDKVFCVNCNTFGHPASYRGCSSYKKFLSYRNKIAEESKVRKMAAIKNVSSFVNGTNWTSDNRTFANVLSETNRAQEKQEKPFLIQEFLKVAKMLCNPESLTLEERIKNFLGKYKQMTKDQAKAECLKLMQDVQDVYHP